MDQFIATESRNERAPEQSSDTVRAQKAVLPSSSSDGMAAFVQDALQSVLAQDQLSVLKEVLGAKGNLVFSMISDDRSADDEKISGGNRLSEERKSSDQEAVSPQEVQIAVAMTSLGAVWLVARQSALAASLMASVPAWLRLDPLPVLGTTATPAIGGERLDIADHVFGGENTQPNESFDEEGT